MLAVAPRRVGAIAVEKLAPCADVDLRKQRRARQTDLLARGLEKRHDVLDRHVALDVLRRRKRQKNKPPTVSLDQANENEQVANDMDALGEMLRKESRQVALESLAELAPDIRQVILLKIIQGMSLRQVAEIAGVSVSTVNYRLNQGLSELAGRLKRAGVV